MNDCAERILFLANAFEADAPTRLLLSTAVAARTSGRWAVSFAALSRGGPLASTAAQAGETRVIGLRSVADLAGAARFVRLVREFRPSVVHVSLLRPFLVGVPLARLAGAPLIVASNHGMHEWGEGGRVAAKMVPPWFRRVARITDKIVTVSSAAAADLARAGVNASRIAVIHNGVDTARHNPGLRGHRAALVASLFPGDDHSGVLLVGAAGNLRGVKGHAVLVDAAASVAPKLPHARFVVWGDGPLHGDLTRRAAAAGIASRFLFPGRAADVAAAAAACDIFVQPSLGESFGLAAAEAMSCGVPVVASAVGGLPEVVEDGVTGFLLAPGSSRALAAHLLYLAARPALRDAMGVAGRARAVAHFALDKMTDSYLALYETLRYGSAAHG
jgi:glycosyltransferase involved in cell wall biosynthesis